VIDKNENRALVRVRIVGEEYTLRTELSPQHTQSVADHVDRTIRAIMSGGGTVETHKAAILAALQITDELFRARATQRTLDESMQSLSAEVRRWLPPAKRTGSGS